MSGHAPRLWLNAVPVGYSPKARLRIGHLPLIEKEALHALRSDHQGRSLVRNDNEAGITQVIARTEADPPGDIKEVEAIEVPHLVAGLVREWLLDFFLTHNQAVLIRHHRIVLVSNKDDLLHASTPHGVTLPEWLGARVAFSFDDRVIPRPGGRRVVLACEVFCRLFVDAPVSELIARGLRVEGLFVRRNGDQGDTRMIPRRELVGRVRSHSAGVLELDEHIEGVSSIPASEAFVEPRQENIERVLTVIERHFWREITNKLATQKASLASGPERLRRAGEMFAYLAALPAEERLLAPGLTAKLGTMLSSKENRLPDYEMVQKPTLFFDLALRKTHRNNWNQGGLDEHGPADQFQFTPKNLNIAVICQKAKEGRVDTFVSLLLCGHQDKPGFLQRFALGQPNLKQVFTARTAAAKDYLAACNEALTWITDRGKQWNLVLVQIDDGMKALDGDENPYLVTKAFFLRHKAGVQDVELETMEQDQSQLVYSLNNIGLASYAKLGGLPWLLPADQKVSHELVFGLGSYQHSKSRLGPRRRFVGITTVFTGDGRYLLGSRTKAVPFEEYADELLAAIKRAVDDVRADQNWQPNDPVRLVFHAFKPMKDAEVEAVKRLMEGLGLKHAKYAFVHVVDDQPFLVFDEAEQGAPAPGKTRKGVMAAARGMSMRLSGREMLLVMKGPKEVKQASDGLPRPVVLKVHRDSTFDDLVYLSRQVFAFSCHSWRSFFPAPLPITIGYSEMMAEKLRLLQDVTGWSEDAIGGLVGRTRWFL